MEYGVIVASILVPLFVFMLALRPFIKDTIKSELGNINARMEGIEKGFEGFKEGQRQSIDLYLQMTKPGNPHPDKEVLLEKLRNETITESEATLLQNIMLGEREQAERERDTLKAVAIIGILILIAIFLREVSRE